MNHRSIDSPHRARDYVNNALRFPDESAHAHPRLAMQVIEHASWAEEDDVQALWAGLLVSSCSPDGRDDSNLMFVDLLAKLSTPQARLLEHVSVACPKVCSKSGFVVARRTHLSLAEVKRVMRVDDIHRIDRELDHLRAIGLLEDGSGFLFDEMAGTTFEATPEAQVPLGPTALALQMHARVHGAANPLTFFGLKVGHGMMGGDGDA